jgi:hypothetical protein
LQISKKQNRELPYASSDWGKPGQKVGLRGNFESLQMVLMGRFCKFQKQNRELPYASAHWGKPGKCPGVLSKLGFHDLSHWSNAGYAVPALRTTARWYGQKAVVDYPSGYRSWFFSQRIVPAGNTPWLNFCKSR